MNVPFAKGRSFRERKFLSLYSYTGVGRIKIILLIVYTVPNVHHCYHCFKGKCCSWFEGLLSCDTLETAMHYHQNPYVRNITGLHRNYEHKRQIKAIKDYFFTWKMI